MIKKIAIVGLLFSSVLLAQQQDTTSDDEQKTEPQSSAESPSEPVVEQGDFIPSEEISEDQPVAFPVDI